MTTSNLQPVIELKQKFGNYWHGLAARERLLLALAGGLLLIWTVVFGIIKPVQQAEQQAYQKLQSSRSTFEQASAAAAEIVQLRAVNGNQQALIDANQPLDALVSKLAAKAGIPVKGLSQQQNSLQIKVDTLRFADLLTWLKTLKANGIVIETVELGRTAQSGMVEIKQLRVSREGDY
ncbi:type II secretion system protein GspM [Endozoicomonadaceae bacterium StTr2]